MSEFAEAADLLERHAGALRPAGRIEWVRENRRVAGPYGTWTRLDFESWPFQRALYEETSREIVVRKATQLGASEWGITEALYAADALGARSLYVLPVEKPMAADFSKDRIAPAIKHSPLAARVGDVDNVGLRSVGSGWLYLRGSQTEAGLSSVPADALIVDELDFCNQANLPAAERRLGASRLGWTRWIGVPTIAARGIDEKWAASDRHRWLVTCPPCGYEQPLTWEDNVDVEQGARVCGSCRAPLPAEAIAGGRWVAERPGQPLRGYHMSKLMRPQLDLSELVAKSLEAAAGKVEAFRRLDLGEPYTAPGAKLTIEDLAAAIERSVAAGHATPRFGDRPPDELPGACVVGVDVGGNYLRVWIDELLAGKTMRCVWAGTFREGADSGFGQLHALLAHPRVRRCVVDSLPEERLTRELCQRFPKTYRATYSIDPKHPRDIDVDEETKTVKVKRTEALDKFFAALRSGDEQVPPALEALPDAFDELGELVRVTMPDSQGNPVARYSGDGADHLAHAGSYARVAAWIAGHGRGETTVTSPAKARLPGVGAGVRLPSAATVSRRR